MKIVLTFWRVSVYVPALAVWLLVIAVVCHTNFASASARVLAAATTGTSEEEPDSRQAPEEEISANVLGSAPPRATRQTTGGAIFFGRNRSAVGSFISAAYSGVASELSGRNGMGGPLRC